MLLQFITFLAVAAIVVAIVRIAIDVLITYQERYLPARMWTPLVIWPWPLGLVSLCFLAARFTT